MDGRIQNWRESGEHLPPFMRDFHDQKDLFKVLYESVQRANAKDTGGELLDLTWIASHVYTVDVFLWIMAAHGYTLQRSRKPFEFAEIETFVSEGRQRQLNESAKLLNAVFAKNALASAPALISQAQESERTGDAGE